ncbi:hypothetical protein [Haloprofundus marisrubri]|uniref:hypothetical protein n=1 Tax=Haloprofundus marisrubri TaxID=1514971 RepID=UPI0012BA6B32|nr:hypothetical protein [Haloprofundus marisrubri]
MVNIRRPLVYGLAVAVGTFIGFVVLGDSSVEAGLLGAVGAFVVMFALRFFFG